MSFSSARATPATTKCDCRAAFNQLPLRVGDRPKTAFWWRRELWQYNRLLYGLRNATSHFQRVMDTHIREWGLQDFVVCYVDDLLVFSRTAAEHVQHLARLFEMLRAIGIKLHPEKTLFAADAVEFLGHMVSRAGLQPTQAACALLCGLRAPGWAASPAYSLGARTQQGDQPCFGAGNLGTSRGWRKRL
ncbi:Retrotransposable element Tf2 protein type 1 [Tetrabaena socialis]|uniref:Retrotransposable element Tf2 protein type 1 n=1 Tax=Tetrabaena socialis TaxID=47790 RepID=A0A2J8A9U5_9CHLO|nr:Retrotransposable element Tf2 protein type 1 [Tetrabaena socialis]|eukprot:PNH09253.1 Retrotransposable element Tf2 protein type 1 [Tetrabaena socialis]